MLLLMCALASTVCGSSAERPEISFDIWDWTAPAGDLGVFEAWVVDLKSLGVTRVELSVPWEAIEPQAGAYDCRWVLDRLAVCKRHGLSMRLRINSYYAGAMPDWYEGDQWVDSAGQVLPFRIPSFMDERFWVHYGEMCKRIAQACTGEDILYSAFIGIHAELKWSEWWSYDASTQSRWRAVIRAVPRADWLTQVAGDTALPDTPPVPAATHGEPDLSPVNRAWIAFREQCWREALDRFAAALRAGDPNARVSSPLGESYRRESAAMSNLDYWGLSRRSEQVVHSYDFFWHGPGQSAAWNAAAAVDSFRGITGRPVCFEFDSFDNLAALGFSNEQLLALGREAALAGAGLKLANDSYGAQLPSQRQIIKDLIALWDTLPGKAAYRPDYSGDQSQTALFFVSKWANYSYRETTQWVHDAQLGAYKLLRDLGIPTRIVCEDNLDELLNAGSKGALRYRFLYVAFSPRDLMPADAVSKLDRLEIPRIEEIRGLPPRQQGTVTAHGVADVSVSHRDCPAGPTDLVSIGAPFRFGLTAGNALFAAYKPGQVVLGYPLGFLYLHGEADGQRAVFEWALRQAEGLPQMAALAVPVFNSTQGNTE